MGAGQRLDSALKHTHHYGQNPEMYLGGHEHGKNGDSKIGEYADAYELSGVYRVGQVPDDNRGGESYDLRHQQSQQKPGGVKAQGGAVGCGHVNNGIDTVDVEEKGENKHEDFPAACQFPDGVPELDEVIQLIGHKMGLLIYSQQRKGAGDPPEGDNKKGDDHGGAHAQTQKIGAQHQAQTDQEGKAAADIDPGIALGGDVVHAFMVGNVTQHGVVKNKAEGVAHTGQNKDEQKAFPTAGKAQQQAAHSSKDYRKEKQRLFPRGEPEA